MSDKNDGGPAFPETRWDDKTRQDVQWCGMSLREWLASHASEKDIDYAMHWVGWDVSSKPLTDVERRACARYVVADAMLKAREQ